MNLIPFISIHFLFFLVGGIAAAGSRRKKAEFRSDLAPFLSSRRNAVSLSRQSSYYSPQSLAEECCGEGCTMHELEEYRKVMAEGRSSFWVKLLICKFDKAGKKCRCKIGNKWQDCLTWAQEGDGCDYMLRLEGEHLRSLWNREGRRIKGR